MEQSKSPIVVDLSTAFSNDKPITETELIYHLTKSTKGAVMLSEEKRKFLLDLQKNRVDVLHNAKLFDAALGSDVNKALDCLIPRKIRTIKREMKNDDLAKLIARLLPPMVILRNYLVSQYKLERDRKPQLRSTTTANKHPMNNSNVYLLMEQAYVLNEKLEQLVIVFRSIPTENTVCKPVFLTTLQRKRRWDKSRVPVHLSLQYCVVCGHQSTNLPQENDELEELNRLKKQEYQANIQKWDAYTQSVAKGNSGSK